MRSVPRGRSIDRELPAALSRGLRQELVLARRPEPGDARRWPRGTAGLLRSALCPPVKPGAPRPFFSTDSFVGIEFGSLTLVEWGQVNIICNFEYLAVKVFSDIIMMTVKNNQNMYFNFF